jgi:hypothetical protein
MLDIPDVDRPKFMTSGGLKRHLLLEFGRAFGLVPAIEDAMSRHDAATGARRDFNAHLKQGSMHAPLSDEGIFLLFANLVGNFERDDSGCLASTRLVLEPFDSLFTIKTIVF